MDTTGHPQDAPPAAPALDPEAGEAWEPLRQLVGGVHLSAESLPAMRGGALLDREALLAAHPCSVRDVTVPGLAGGVELAASVFTPEGHVGGGLVLYWIHGGGMVLGSREMVSEALDVGFSAGAVVVSIDYRLAPEHPAPAPGDDCLAGLRWVAEHAAALGGDPSSVVMGGTSAGGGLAAATALRARDEGGPALAGLLLFCPMLDDRMATVSSHQYLTDVLWTRASNEFGWRSLLGERFGTDDVSIHEAPGRATAADLAGLPPAYVDVGSADLFRDEDVAFASALWAAGGDCELHVWPGGYHGFELLAPAAAISVDLYEARRRWLRRLLARR